MKIKKSELIALIKEEIMKEAPFGRGMTMMDEKELERDDDMMYEGTLKEGFDPNDFMTMAKAIKQLLSDPYTGPMFAAIIGGLPVMAAYEKHVLGKMNKGQPPAPGGDE